MHKGMRLCKLGLSSPLLSTAVMPRTPASPAPWAPKPLWLSWTMHSMGRLGSELSPSTSLVLCLILFAFSTEESQACGPATGTETSLLMVTERKLGWKQQWLTWGLMRCGPHTLNPKMHVWGPFALPQAPETAAPPRAGINGFIQHKFYYFHFRGNKKKEP